MTERDREILRLALPALAALATTPLYVLVDTAIVGHLGTPSLGGLAVASTVLNTIFFVTTFLEYGITARVARHLGRGDRPAAVGAGVQGAWMALAVGTVLGLAILAGGREAAGVVGGHGTVLDKAGTYLRISAAWCPAQLLVLVGNGYLRGVLDTRTPLWIALGGNVVNVVAEVVFVYGLHLGIAGSAWGTVLATWLAAASFVAVGVRHVRATAAPVRPDGVALRRLLRTGGHLSVRTGALLGTLALGTAVAARLGPSTLGGHQIALQVETFLALVVDGLAIAGQALVGTSLGAGDAVGARATGRRLLHWGVRAGAALTVIVVATSGVLPHLFSHDTAVRDRATVGLLLVGVLQFPAAIVFVLDGVLLGASDDAFQGWSNVVALAVYVPFALAVLHWHRLGIAGVWAGLVAWMLARMVANTTRFGGRRWARPAAPTA